MTNCSLILVVLSLIGLGLGDSPLVILSLCSLVLFFVISSSLISVCFLVFFSLSVCFFLCTLCSALCFHEVASWIYIFLTFKKKKNSSLASCTYTISWVLSKCCEVLIYAVKSVVTGIELNKSVTGSNIWGSLVLILSV